MCCVFSTFLDKVNDSCFSETEGNKGKGNKIYIFDADKGSFEKSHIRWTFCFKPIMILKSLKIGMEYGP